MCIISIMTAIVCRDIYMDVISSIDKIIEKILKNKQSEYQKENYPDASISTSIDCVICGGLYTQRSRSIHNNTKKHKKCINIIKKYYLVSQP